jgi:mannose-6-phosphate isomerase-like protein (cupin superfamily)
MSIPLRRSYPPDTYHGTGGEVSAWVRRTTEPPDLTFGNDVTCEYLATGDRTEERFGLYRWTFGEEEAGPPAHFHRAISEQFYVLSGQVQLYDGAAWVTAGPGDFLYVPEGGVHGFRGGGGASMLLMFAPGAPREDYFETLARGESLSEEQWADFMARHDTWWV